MLLTALLLAPLLCQNPARDDAARAPATRVELDIPCRTIGSYEQRLDAYLPAEPGPHAAVLLVHGGAWMHGNRRDMREFGELLARAGYACFAVGYRLAPEHRWPAQLEDCLYAVQFVRANAARFAIDPARVGALGLSAGGHLVAQLGVLPEGRDEHATDPVLRQSTRVQCVVDYFGPVLLARTPEFDFDTRPPPELFGDAPDSVYADASPLNHVSKDDAPFLLVHGDADTLVPVGHALAMEEKLRAAGVACELFVIPGGGHGDFFGSDPLGEYWKTTERFLARRLGPKGSGMR